MIQIDDLHFRYADSAFQLSLPCWKVEAGSQCALTGPSGSGKTTLLSLIAGILTPVTGSVLVGQQKVSQLSGAERRNFRIQKCGLIFQGFELIPYLDVLQNIQLPYYLNPVLVHSPEVEILACQLAEQVGLSGCLQTRVSSLSAGEQQRLAVCRALITRPEIMLADEPTASLDQENAARVMQVLFDDSKNNGTTLVMSTHDPNLFSQFEQQLDFSDLTQAPAHQTR